MRSEFFNTLKVEWLKVRNYRTFWILLVVTAACMPAFNYVIYDFTDNSLPKFNGQSILGNPFSFPAVWRTVPYNSGLLVFLPAILVITLFTNEFSFRTHRQNIIDGWSRSRFIHIKLLEVLALTIGVTILEALTCVCFGFLTKTLSVRPHWNDVRFIFYFFVELLNYLMIALLIALLVRRAGLSMGIFFLYMIIEQFVVVIGRNKYKKDWVDYLPEEVTDRLIPQPFGRQMMTSAQISLWENHVALYLSIGILYVLLYIFFIRWKFRKTDL
jgi:hypothetical protein